MSLFPGLAPELIQRIGNELDILDIKSFRLTCRSIGEILVSQVLHKLTINLTQQTAAKDIQKLQDWALDSHAAAHATRKLVINSICPTYDPTCRPSWCCVGNELVASYPERWPSSVVKLAEKTSEVCLCKAISSMISVKAVQWMPTSKDPESTQRSVIDALATLPKLESLVVRMSYHKVQQRFDSLPPLQEISFIGVGKESHASKLICKSPGLLSLSLEGYHYFIHDAPNANQSLHTMLEAYPKDIPPLRLRKLHLKCFLIRLDEITLPHLRHLTSLELTNIFDPFKHPGQIFVVPDPGFADSRAHQDQKLHGSSVTDVWLALAKAKIDLQEIRTDHVSPGFLTYLESYSGLEKLKLMPGGFEDGLTSDEFGSRFFDTPFQNHIRSIKELTIEAPYEGFWCFSADNAGIIAQCTKLYSLSMRIMSPSYSDVGHSELAALIKLFLDTVAENLPILETLWISSADPESSRGDWCGTGADDYTAYTDRKISEGVKKYRAQSTCTRLPDLHIGLNTVTRRTFKPALDRQGEGREGGAPRLIYVTNSQLEEDEGNEYSSGSVSE